jgi:ETFB lysine methyltransferase
MITPERSPSLENTVCPAFDLPAEQLRRYISARYDTVERTVIVAGSPFTLLKVRDTNRLVDEIEPSMFALDERLPYWADIWSSSVALAQYCLEAWSLTGRTVLELGCGLGLAGIGAARAGGIVTLTDYEDDALCFARLNAAMNLPADLCAADLTLKRLDWRSMDDPGTFDLILASDVVYERRNFLPLLDVVGRALAPHGRALVTDPDRSMGKEFVSVALARGFSVAAFSSPVDVDGRPSSIIRYELQRPVEGSSTGGGDD